MSAIEKRVDTLAFLAKTEATINASLSILELGCSVKVSNMVLAGDQYQLDWSRKVLVGEYVKDACERLGVAAGELLASWLSNNHDQDVIESCARAVRLFKSVIEYRQNFIESFNREALATEYLGDGLTPTGDVHYRILYTYQTYSGRYTRDRVKACEFESTFWDDNPLWFDYLGPEENVIGLIRHIDY